MKQVKVQPDKWEIQLPDPTFNAYVWTGLTEGKLHAIYQALKVAKANGELGAVGEDCRIILFDALREVGQIPYDTR